MVGEVLFYDSRKDLAFRRTCQWLSDLEVPWEEGSDIDHRRKSNGGRNFTLAVIVIEGGEKPQFPVRSGQDGGDYVQVSKYDGEWVVEVGWINYWRVPNSRACEVFAERVVDVAGERPYRGVVGTYDRFSQLPDYVRNRMDIAIGMTDWGVLAEYAGRRDDSDVRRTPVVKKTRNS